MTFTAIYANFPQQCVICKTVTTNSYTTRVDIDKRDQTAKMTHFCSAACFKHYADQTPPPKSKL